MVYIITLLIHHFYVQIILSFCFSQGKLGAAFFDASTNQVRSWFFFEGDGGVVARL